MTVTKTVYGFTAYGPGKHQEYTCSQTEQLDAVMRELQIAIENGAREAVVTREVQCACCGQEVHDDQ